MFTLHSDIQIGGKTFAGVHEVTIKRSIYTLGATATVKVPVTAVLKQMGEPGKRVETAKEIKVGHEVLIRLGYNGACEMEFRGWVKQLNLCAPLEIICEDAFYQARKRSVTMSGKTTLADVLRKCALTVGYATTLTLESFPVANKPVAWVLAKLKKEYGLSVYFDLEGKIYACEPFKVIGEPVKYKLRGNTIKDDDLKFQRAEDVKLKIKAVCIYRNGTQVEATIGVSDGTEKILYFYNVADKNELATLAAAELKRYSYDGYSGKIETFLQPSAAPGMVAEIEDNIYSERNGRYYIESVETKFGLSGARRTVEIGLKI